MNQPGSREASGFRLLRPHPRSHQHGVGHPAAAAPWFTSRPSLAGPLLGLVALVLGWTALAAGAPADAGAGSTTGGGMVACLGRIDPDLVHLVPPASSFPVPPPVAEVLVKEGDHVTRGQTVAVMENKERLETAWHAAQAQAQAAERRLERVKGPVRQTEIAAQQAEVERLGAEVELARKDHARNQGLRQGSAITEAEFDRSRLLVEAREKALLEAQLRLKNLQEAQAVDIRIGEAELQAAQAQARHAEAELQQAIVHAPSNGVIIRIYAKPGERIDTDGLLALAQVDPMYVTAEVYETDVRYVQPGQRAEITCPASPEAFTGVVEEVRRQVGRNRVLDNDPANIADARVVEVRIRLNPNTWSSRLIGARVTVRIQR